MIYSAPTTRKMLSFYFLDYHNTPPIPEGKALPTWLRVELFLLAGGLYFDWNDHQAVCDFLGIHPAGADEMEHWADIPGGAQDGLDCEASNAVAEQKPKIAQRFTTRPLTFLQEWLSIRRRGQDFAHSPMGYIAQGKPLQGNHPFFHEGDLEPLNMGPGGSHPKKEDSGDHFSASTSSPSEMECTEGESSSSWADDIIGVTPASD